MVSYILQELVIRFYNSHCISLYFLFDGHGYDDVMSEIVDKIQLQFFLYARKFRNKTDDFKHTNKGLLRG